MVLHGGPARSPVWSLCCFIAVDLEVMPPVSSVPIWAAWRVTVLQHLDIQQKAFNKNLTQQEQSKTPERDQKLGRYMLYVVIMLKLKHSEGTKWKPKLASTWGPQPTFANYAGFSISQRGIGYGASPNFECDPKHLKLPERNRKGGYQSLGGV